ncbi:MAG: hypothetical protein AAB667_00940 [Patescibacteria group bacterium]
MLRQEFKETKMYSEKKNRSNLLRMLVGLLMSSALCSGFILAVVTEKSWNSGSRQTIYDEGLKKGLADGHELGQGRPMPLNKLENEVLTVIACERNNYH